MNEKNCALYHVNVMYILVYFFTVHISVLVGTGNRPSGTL